MMMVKIQKFLYLFLIHTYTYKYLFKFFLDYLKLYFRYALRIKKRRERMMMMMMELRCGNFSLILIRKACKWSSWPKVFWRRSMNTPPHSFVNVDSYCIDCLIFIVLNQFNWSERNWRIWCDQIWFCLSICFFFFCLFFITFLF